MTTEPPAGSGWQPPAGGYPPPQPAGGQPDPQQFPTSYPPPGRVGPTDPAQQPLPPQPLPPQPQSQPDPYAPQPDPYPQQPPPQPSQPGGQQVFLPDPPSTGGGFDALPEPPPDLQPALQWGDPTPAVTPPPRPGPPAPLSRLAIAAAALGVLLGGAGLSLIVGLVAFLRLRTSGKRGRGLAIAAMILAPAWALTAGVVYYLAVVANPPLRDANGVVIRKGDVKVDKLRIGDCVVNFAISTSVDSLIVVPCTQPHNAEVFHTFELAGKEYPGDGIVREQSTSTCSATSKTAVKPDDLKNAQVALLKPIPVSWKRGQHGVTCLAVQNSGTISRSIRK